MARVRGRRGAGAVLSCVERLPDGDLAAMCLQTDPISSYFVSSDRLVLRVSVSLLMKFTYRGLLVLWDPAETQCPAPRHPQGQMSQQIAYMGWALWVDRGSRGTSEGT